MDKQIIKEEQTVNEVQLRDLYTAASKVEIQIVNLAELAVSFSDQTIKQAVMVLRSKAHELSTLIGDVMMNSDQPIAGLEQQPSASEDDTKLNLDAPSDKKVIESSEFDGDSLEESEEMLKAERMSKHAMTFITKKYGINESDARKVLAEAFAKESRQIDLSTPYKMVMDGTATFAQFKGTIFNALNERHFGEEYKTLISDIRDAGTPELYEAAMNKIYDFADANEIVIKTI